MSENDKAVTVLKNEAQGMVVWAETVMVTTKAEADTAMTRLSDIKGVRARIVVYWSPVKKAAHDAWKGIVSREKDLTDICDKAEVVVKQKVLAWQQAEQRKAAVEQARLQAAADEAARRERERLEKEAAKLKTPEKRAERLEQAAAVQAQVVTVAVPQAEAAGTATRTTWKAECVDKDALIAAAVPGSVAASLLAFDQKAADAFARGSKGKISVPGVTFVEVQSLSVRAG